MNARKSTERGEANPTTSYDPYTWRAAMEKAAEVVDAIAAESIGGWRASAGKVAARIRSLPLPEGGADGWRTIDVWVPHNVGEAINGEWGDLLIVPRRGDKRPPGIGAWVAARILIKPDGAPLPAPPSTTKEG